MTREDMAGKQAEARDRNTLSVVGVFDDDGQATAAEQALEQAGFSRDDISVVVKAADEQPAEIDVGRRIVSGAAKGALAAGLAAVLVLAPGVGPLLAAGPIAFMLGAGGIVGSFVGLGMAREQAQRYENMVRAGAEVVIVRAATEQRAVEAKRVLSQHGAHDVQTN